MTKLQTEHLAMLAVTLSGFAWGLFWIPLRALESSGISGVWAIVLFYLLPTVLLLPAFYYRFNSILKGGWSLHIAGILAGTSLVLYSGALVFTEVVRALMLFYIAPLWSTLLARVLIGEAITRVRWATIALALIGLLLILRLERGFDDALGIGDWMGLASGIIWALASVLMKSDKKTHGVDFTLSYFFYGSLVAILLTLLPIEDSQAIPTWDSIKAVLIWITPVIVLLVIPPAFAIMWGATLLSPGLLVILFMTEISSGTLTAAIWANEPFGLREFMGVIVITVAGGLEPAMQLRKKESNKP